MTCKMPNEMPPELKRLVEEWKNGGPPPPGVVFPLGPLPPGSPSRKSGKRKP